MPLTIMSLTPWPLAIDGQWRTRCARRLWPSSAPSIRTARPSWRASALHVSLSCAHPPRVFCFLHLLQKTDNSACNLNFSAHLIEQRASYEECILTLEERRKDAEGAMELQRAQQEQAHASPHNGHDGAGAGFQDLAETAPERRPVAPRVTLSCLHVSPSRASHVSLSRSLA